MAPREVFVTGGTGYLGSRLAARLVQRGHRVRTLVRPGSESRLPAGCESVAGDALDEASIARGIASAAASADRTTSSRFVADTFVQLVGVSHPSPAKARQFRDVDLVSVRAAVAAAAKARVAHFVYVSVAQPSPVMRAYVEVRAEAERLIRESGMNATILRPWYVLGPGHRWAYALVPVYKVLEWIPATREGALRLGMVTLAQMLRALVDAVEAPAQGVRIITVPEIRASAASVVGRASHSRR